MNRWAIRALATVNLSSSDNSSIPEHTQKQKEKQKEKQRNQQKHRNRSRNRQKQKQGQTRTEKLFKNRGIKDEFLKR